MRKLEIFSIILSGIILTIGFWAGFYCSPLSFSRSGSLLVVIGILVAAFGIRAQFGSVLLEVIVLAISQRPDITKKLYEEGRYHDEVEKAYAEAVKDLFGDAKSEIQKRMSKVLFVELVIVIVGTLVWGFGDLVYKYI